MTKAVHPFTQHLARWKEAQKRLPQAHEQAKSEAVGHIHRAVISAAHRSPGMDPDDVGTIWYKQQPHIAVRGGTNTEALEYGTLTEAPRATIRNAARRADKEAVRVYHSTLWKGMGV